LLYFSLPCSATAVLPTLLLQLLLQCRLLP
jgi:hypothetical protein